VAESRRHAYLLCVTPALNGTFVRQVTFASNPVLSTSGRITSATQLSRPHRRAQSHPPPKSATPAPHNRQRTSLRAAYTRQRAGPPGAGW
jgi:hypothetical protein